MSTIVLGDYEDVGIIDTDPSYLLLNVHGIDAEVRQASESGPLVLPVADETHTRLNRKVYRLEPYGSAPFQREWLWFAQYKKFEIATYRTARIRLEFFVLPNEPPITWMPKEKPAEWSVDIDIGGIRVAGPYVEFFSNAPVSSVLSRISNILRAGK